MLDYDYEKYFDRPEKREHALRKAKIDEKFLSGLADVPTLNIGSGITTRLQTPHIHKLVCGDISSASVKLLQSEGIEAVCFDARNEWPFPDNSFEQIIAIDVFEHLGQVNGFLKELTRVSKKGAVIVIGIPLLNNWRNYLSLLFMTTHNVQYDEHPRMFFDKDIKSIFQKAGFKLDNVKYLGMKGYGYYRFQCLK
ncbi:MAG: class I SAM-dependent methyltransferase [Candidatus Diapherotrites archaeon]